MVLYPVIAVLLAGLYFTFRGFPPLARDWVRDAAERRGFSLEFADMRLDPGHGIVFSDVRVFARGVLGPPLIDAGELGVELKPFAREPSARLQGILIRNGRLREDATAAMFRGSSVGGGRDAATRVAFRVSMIACDLQRLPVARLQCDYRADADGVRLENIVATVGRDERSGPLSGWLHVRADGSYQGKVHTQVDPYELIPFLTVRNEDGIVELIRTFSFPAAAPRVEAAFERGSGPDASLKIHGKFTGRNFDRYGVRLTSAEAPMEMEFGSARRTVSLLPLTAVRPEGVARVGFTVDLASATVRFDGTSTADPRAIAQVIAPGAKNLFRDFVIDGPAECRARGTVSLTDARQCRVDATIRARNFGFPGFVAEECDFGYHRLGTTTRLDNFFARILDGAVTGSVTLAEGPTGTTVRVEGRMEDADFRRVLETVGPSFRPPKELTGRISGDLSLEGIWGKGQERTLNGHCSFHIRNGTLFDLPVFGGMSETLVGVVPGLDFVLRQTDAQGVFTIRDGFARSEDLRIEGDVLSLKADGGYDLLTRALDFDVELRFLKKKTWIGEILQTVLLPVTKLFRVRIQGTPDKAKWRSVNF